MKLPLVKIWSKNFFKSLVWLILPLCILGNINSCSNYKEAGTHLTPFSVNVEGYYRSDGTYVYPHKRRPPGSVKHDAPYEQKRIQMGLLFFVCLVGGCGSILIFTKLSILEIEKQREFLLQIENKIKEEERQRYVNEILISLDFNFSELISIPPNLNRGQSTRCKFCKSYISTNDFYVSFVAVSKRHTVCMNCVQRHDSIGRNQPKSKYINALKYFVDYSKLLNEFKIRFNSEVNSDEFKFSDSDIKRIFDSELYKKPSRHT